MDISIISKEDCIDTILNINRNGGVKDYTKKEKYKLYLAKEYFTNNIVDFSPEELEKVNQNSYIINGLKSNEIIYVLDQFIRLEKSCSISLASFFNKQIPNQKKEKYLEILNKENNVEELEKISKLDPGLIISSFVDLNNPCDFLLDFMIKKNIVYFSRTNNWSIEKKIDFLFENKNVLDFLDFFKHKSSLDLQPKKIQDVIFEKILNDLEQKNDKLFTRDILEKSTENFLIYVSEKNENFFNIFMESYFHHENNITHNPDDDTINIFKKTIVVNGAQYLLLNRGITSIDGINLFKNRTDLVLASIEEDVKLYTKATNPLEYALKNEEFGFFTVLDYEKLSEEEKHITIAAAFTYYCLDNESKQLQDWSFDVLTRCDLSWFQVYAQKCRDLNLMEDKLKDLESISLLKNLDTNLSNENKNKPNKMKI